MFKLPVLFAAALLGAVSLHAGTIRIDFGRSDGIDGNETASPDASGHHWNNFSAGFTVDADLAIENLVTTENAATSLGITVTSEGWFANGIRNGGLLSPNAEWLGDFAEGTATEDYFFVDGAREGGNLRVTGLDPERLYDFRLFATRATDDVRETTYRIIAGNGVFTETLQTSGPESGTDAYNGNDRNIVTFEDVQSDASGEATIQVVGTEGGFGYIGILEIVEGEAAPALEAATPAVVRIDFGRHDDGNGNPTSSPDEFGGYWNNFAVGAAVPAGSEVHDLVTTENAPTNLSVTIDSGGWLANGIKNGGLLEPDPALLGDLAVATATQDYFFVDQNTGRATFTIGGLDPTKLYDLRFFGSRASGDVRRSRYTVTAANGVFNHTLQTTGTDIGANGYDGNNNRVIRIDGVQADTSTRIQVELAIAEGTFAYIGILEIIESATVPPIAEPPPPSIANWVEQDELDPLEPGAVLFVGSSSIRRWESLTEDFADYRIIQRGFGGSHLSELNQVAKFIVLPYRPSAIVLWEGTNDISSGKTAERVFGDYQTFVGLVREEMPEVPIFYLGVTPTLANGHVDEQRRLLNSLIENATTGDPTLHYIDLPEFFESLDSTELRALYVDDIHLNRAGYAEWLNIVRPALEAVIAPNKDFVPNTAALEVGERLLFDFGPSDPVDGDPTVSPDSNGNHWNNWFDLAGGGGVNSGEHLANLISATGRPTGIRLIVTGGFYVNGKRNGGLLAPGEESQAVLGNLGIASATEDYFYSTADDRVGGGDDDTPGGFMLEGLNPNLVYEFRVFGSRNTAATRVTSYRVTGRYEQTVTLQTSGSDIGSDGAYDGNDDEVAVVSGVKPDAFGQVFIDLLALEGDFAYINAMEVRAVDAGFAAWRSEFFAPGELGETSLEASVWGAGADPDGDGRDNLMEYATGTHPRHADQGGEIVSLEDSEGEPWLTLTFWRNASATDVTLQPETSVDFVDWEDVNDVLISSDDGLELRKASVTTDGFSRRLLRLRAAVLAGEIE